MLKALRHPLFWFSVLLSFFVLHYNLKNDNLKQVVGSDGRGYYAYLPAFFIFNDPNYVESKAAEKRITGSADRYYLFKDDKGKTHNKYFPGVALMQTPFFVGACAVSYVFGKEINGYSNTFQLFLLLGSLFYSVGGLFLFYKSLNLLFPAYRRFIRWFVPLVYLATPLWFYSVVKPSFTHHLSFFLFGLFTLVVVKMRKKTSVGSVLFLGLVLGLIALVRPTNLLVILLVPFLLGSSAQTLTVWRALVAQRGLRFWVGCAGFFSMLFLLLLIWRWQSGEWFVWSYKGEGFNWLRPQLWANLFSFRIGLFVHTPVLVLSILGSYYLYRKNSFQFAFWFVYFLVNIWVVAAWWCWDYESPFGNRPTTEHMFFLTMPVFFGFEKHRKYFVGFMIFCALLSSYRYYQFTSGALPNQRFTPASYFKSLQFWQSYPSNRFNFTRSPEAFGEKKEERVLLDYQGEKQVTADMEFPLGGEATLDTPRTYERYYYRVELDRKFSGDYFEDVHLVVDAYNADFSARYYMPSELFNDRFAGRNEWEHLIFEGTILDNFQELTHAKLYIWNQGQQDFFVRNVKITLMKYMAE